MNLDQNGSTRTWLCLHMTGRESQLWYDQLLHWSSGDLSRRLTRGWPSGWVRVSSAPVRAEGRANWGRDSCFYMGSYSGRRCATEPHGLISITVDLKIRSMTSMSLQKRVHNIWGILFWIRRSRSGHSIPLVSFQISGIRILAFVLTGITYPSRSYWQTRTLPGRGRLRWIGSTGMD